MLGTISLIRKLKIKSILDLTDSEDFMLTVSQTLVGKYGHNKRAAIQMILNYPTYKEISTADKDTLAYINHYDATYWAKIINGYYQHKEIAFFDRPF